MAKSTNRIKIKLVSEATGHMRYSTKNRINTTDKVELKKYDPVSGKQELYKEKKFKK